MTVAYRAEITIYFVENGMVIKNGNPESMISKLWIAKTKDELTTVVMKIYDEIEKLRAEREGKK